MKNLSHSSSQPQPQSSPQSSSTQPLSGVNLLLLGVSVFLSLATLTSSLGGFASHTSTLVETRGQILTVTLHPASEHVEDLDSLLPLALKLTVDNALLPAAEDARWRLKVLDSDLSDSTSFQGTFHPEETWTDDGRKYAHLSANSPPFCPALERATSPDDSVSNDEENMRTSDSDSLCIACDLQKGCTLEIRIDVCEDPVNEYYFMTTLAQEDGSELRIECEDSENPDLCQKITEWMTVESRPLESNFCAE